jgi:hypothetical protein
MKKKEKYYPVNSQEDEDGYTHYPAFTGSPENIKESQDIDPQNDIINTEPGTSQILFNSLVPSPAASADK